MNALLAEGGDMSSEDDSANSAQLTVGILGAIGCLGIFFLIAVLFFVPFLVVLLASTIAGDETNNASATCGAPAIEAKEGSKTVNVPRAIPKTRQRRLQRSRSPRANHRSPTPSNSPR